MEKIEQEQLVISDRELVEDILSEIKERIVEYNTPDDPALRGGNQTNQAQSDTDKNAGTMILDAGCDRFYYFKPREINGKNGGR